MLGSAFLSIRGYPLGLAFSPDGSILASGMGNNVVTLLDVKTGAVLTRLTGYHAAVRELVFSPVGSTLITSSDEGTIWVWEVSH